MSYFTKQSAAGRPNREVREQARKFNSASSKREAQGISKKTGAMYTEVELLLSKNSEHCITEKNLVIFKKRLKSLKVPSDVDRLPTSFCDKASLSGFTAEQFKIFITIYSRSCFYGLIPEKYYKNVVFLAEAIELACQHSLSLQELDFKADAVMKHQNGFLKRFGKWEMSVNYHMVTHIGSCPGFWCFAFERMNGELMGYPSSGRQVEKEMANRYLTKHSVLGQVKSNPPPDMVSIVPKQLAALSQEPAQSIESARIIQRIAYDRFCKGDGDEAFRYQMQVEREELDTVKWSVKFLGPSRKSRRMDREFYSKVVNCMENLYGRDFQMLHGELDKHGQCEVNRMIFSSELNRTERGSIASALFVERETGQAAEYYGIINFFLEAKVIFRRKNSLKTKQHSLAFVKWFMFANPNHALDPQSNLPAVKKQFYQTDQIINVRRLVKKFTLCRVSRSNYFLVEAI